MQVKSMSMEEAVRLMILRDQIDTRFAGTVQRMTVENIPRLVFVYDEFIFICDENKGQEWTEPLVTVYPKSDDERTSRLVKCVRYEMEESKSGPAIIDCVRQGFVPDVLVQSLIDGDCTAKICQADITKYITSLAKLA